MNRFEMAEIAKQTKPEIYGVSYPNAQCAMSNIPIWAYYYKVGMKELPQSPAVVDIFKQEMKQQVVSACGEAMADEISDLIFDGGASGVAAFTVNFIPACIHR